MCGLCGILGEPDGGERARRVARMRDALTHRGPDEDGSYRDGQVELGFRRLSVIDLETGSQPIRLESDRAVIVLNGEIYNFRELRRELEGRHTFRTKGDVEVVLRLWDELRLAALPRLNGMFALAIWDKERRTLHLARDRFGIKPLYICRSRSGLAFASELGALRAAGLPEDLSLDRWELRHYLAQGYCSPTGTPLAAVRQLEPGSVLTIDDEGHETQSSFWEPPQPELSPPSRREALARVEATLAEATRRQLVADVPVGVFLSGGLDSSTLSALVRRAGTETLRTFSVGFVGPGAVNELPEARRVAEHLESEHHEIVMDPSEVAGAIDAILGGLDLPLGDATAIPTWFMSRLARENVTVALSGEGADEIFGGYARQRLDAQLESLATPLRALLPFLLRLFGRRPSRRLRERLVQRPGLARMLDWSRLLVAREIDGLLTEPLSDELALLRGHASAAARFEARRIVDPVTARLEADRELFLPGDLLPKVDRMSMAHSLEVRVPFLDNEVADLMIPLPGRYKQGLRRGKVLLRELIPQLLPAEVARRPKRGFEVPIDAWLRGPLRPLLTDLLATERVRRRGLFRPEAVAGYVEDHLAGRAKHGKRLWALLVLEDFLTRSVDVPVEAA